MCGGSTYRYPYTPSAARPSVSRSAALTMWIMRAASPGVSIGSRCHFLLTDLGGFALTRWGRPLGSLVPPNPEARRPSSAVRLRRPDRGFAHHPAVGARRLL